MVIEVLGVRSLIWSGYRLVLGMRLIPLKGSAPAFLGRLRAHGDPLGQRNQSRLATATSRSGESVQRAVGVKPSSLGSAYSRRSGPIEFPLLWDVFGPSSRGTHLGTLAYDVFFHDLTKADLRVLEWELLRAAEEDRPFDAALACASGAAPRLGVLADAELEAGWLRSGGYVVWLTFGDESFATARVPKQVQRVRSDEPDRPLALWLSTSQLGRSMLERAALAEVGYQIGLIKTCALVSDRIVLSSPHTEQHDERAWASFFFDGSFDWNGKPKDRERLSKDLADDPILGLCPSDLVPEIVRLQTDMKILRHERIFDLATDEPVWEVRTTRPATLQLTWDQEAALVAQRWGQLRAIAEAPEPVVFDARSATALKAAMQFTRSRPSTDASGIAPVAGRVLSAAALYAARAVPNLHALPAEAVLALRDELGDSLSAFRSRIDELVVESTSIDERDEVGLWLREISPTLDREFGDLKRAAASSRISAVSRERAPVGLGAGAALGFQLGLAGRVVAGSSAFAAGALGQFVVNAAEVVRRRGSLGRHPLYWRLVMSRTPMD